MKGGGTNWGGPGDDETMAAPFTRKGTDSAGGDFTSLTLP